MTKTEVQNLTHDDMARLLAKGRRERSKAFHAMTRTFIHWLSPARETRSQLERMA